SNGSLVASDTVCTPLTLRTYWRAAASISSSVADGSRPRRTVMFRHIPLTVIAPPSPGETANATTVPPSRSRPSRTGTAHGIPSPFETSLEGNHRRALYSPQGNYGGLGRRPRTPARRRRVAPAHPRRRRGVRPRRQRRGRDEPRGRALPLRVEGRADRRPPRAQARAPLAGRTPAPHPAQTRRRPADRRRAGRRGPGPTRRPRPHRTRSPAPATARPHRAGPQGRRVRI